MIYEFQNADICPAARLAFAETPTSVDDAVELCKAARHVDQAMGILKRGYAHGSLNEHDYDEFLSHLEDAEGHLETLGVLEDHEYLRDDLEQRAVELFDLDNVDVDDDASDFADEESWMFGADSSED